MSGYGRFPPPPGAPGAGGGPGRFPPPPAAPGNFAPPPPANTGGGGQPVGGAPPSPMQHLNTAMSGVNLNNGGGQQHHSNFQPPPPPNPGMNQPSGAGGFRPPPPAFGGGGAAPPPPNQPQSFAPPGASGGPSVFKPGPPAPPQPGMGFSAPPPPQPGMGFQSQPPPPQPGMGFQSQPPPPGQQQAPPPPGGGASFYPPGPGSSAPPGAPGGPQGMPGMAQQQAAASDNIDYSIKIPERFFRFTTGKLTQTAAQATSSKIPFGAVLRPLAPDGPEDEEVDTVQPGTAGIIRCKRCRTYINAFVAWTEHGRRWRCNICQQINDTHSAYFCHLDEHGMRTDRFQRPELSKSVVEFIAPAEYMVRPPQEPTYFFVIDVTEASVRSGMLQSIADSIKANLDNLPGRGRTKIGFITFDTGVHYYNLDSDLANPQMLVVADLKELFVPLPEHLLVNLKESRSVVDSFLDSLPEMFSKNPVRGRSCLGPALKAAFTVMKAIGGKMCVFQSMQPNLGDGALRNREQPALMGTPKEVTLLKPDAEFTWYKDTGVEFSRQQISVDMFIFPYQYVDLAALGELAKVTAGTLRSYVMFNRERDGPRFEHDLRRTLIQTTAFESVMRIRCTKGMRITNFYGNFYIRGTDLMALPNCNTDSVFGFDLAHDEQNLINTHVTIQAALLYTSSEGERRIRVMTQALPVSALMSEVIASIDTDACVALLSKQAIEVTLKSGLDNARMRLQQVCVEMVRAARGGDKRTVSGYSVPPPPGQQGGGESDEPIPENLSLLPLYVLALMKNVAFRGGTDIHPDERVQAFHLLQGMGVNEAKNYIYPRLFALHEMGEDAGFPSEDEYADPDRVVGRNRILLPPASNLSIDSLSSEGVYLLDNGVEMFLWVGRNADLNILGSLFGMHSLDDVDPNQLSVQKTGDPFASRFGSIVSALSEEVGETEVIDRRIHITREGDASAEGRFFWFLVEDRAAFQGGTYSYEDFVNFVKNPQASAGAGARGPPGPGGAPPPPGPPGQPGHGGYPPQGQGMAPPGPPGQMAPPRSAPPAFGNQQPPPPPGASYGAPPPPHQPSSYGAPPPGPPQPPSGYGGPPPPGPPQPSSGYGGPPPPGPPRPPSGYGGPPPAPAHSGPPSAYSGSHSGPPPPGPPQSGPPSSSSVGSGSMPAPPGRTRPTPPPPPPGGAQRRMPPPPPRRPGA